MMPVQWAPVSDSETGAPSVLLSLALWSSLTPTHPASLMNLDENRTPKGMPSGIPGIEEAWVSFPREERKVGGDGRESVGGFLKTRLLTHEA